MQYLCNSSWSALSIFFFFSLTIEIRLKIDKVRTISFLFGGRREIVKFFYPCWLFVFFYIFFGPLAYLAGFFSLFLQFNFPHHFIGFSFLLFWRICNFRWFFCLLPLPAGIGLIAYEENSMFLSTAWNGWKLFRDDDGCSKFYLCEFFSYFL